MEQETIGKMRALLRESMEALAVATNSLDAECIFCGCDATPDGKRHAHGCIVSRIRAVLPNAQDQRR